ncbi:PH domain-containing protein [Planctomicrobium sp. SH668]|uniref:PH domain-containing protein n=1 Tax=Planctomicrobium sp. SH668 TaxID=3448126 RepID=UPI003F5B8203
MALGGHGRTAAQIHADRRPEFITGSRTTLTVTTTRTILQRSFFSFSTTEVRHSDVRNIQVTQSLGQRLANSGRIKLSTSGQSGFEIEINGIDNPMHVKSLIDKCRR